MIAALAIAWSTAQVRGPLLVALAGLGRNPALASAIVLALSGLVAQASFWLAAREPEAERSQDEAESAAA